jgi:hypothetical protein
MYSQKLTIEIICSISLSVSAPDLHHLLHALSRKPGYKLLHSAQVLFTAPRFLRGDALRHQRPCILECHAYIRYGKVGAVTLIVRGMLGGALAEKRQVSSCEVGQGVEYCRARRVVACRAKDLEDRWAKERVK